jgi:hypothetical protein
VFFAVTSSHVSAQPYQDPTPQGAAKR